MLALLVWIDPEATPTGVSCRLGCRGCGRSRRPDTARGYPVRPGMDLGLRESRVRRLDCRFPLRSSGCVHPRYGIGAVWVHRLPCVSHLSAWVRAIRLAPTGSVVLTPCDHDVPRQPTAYAQRDGRRPAWEIFLTYPRGWLTNEEEVAIFCQPRNKGQMDSFRRQT